MLLCYFFFFSSRRRHTRCYRDWSSDVCSSDLAGVGLGQRHAEVDAAVGDPRQELLLQLRGAVAADRLAAEDGGGHEELRERRAAAPAARRLDDEDGVEEGHSLPAVLGRDRDAEPAVLAERVPQLRRELVPRVLFSPVFEP